MLWYILYPAFNNNGTNFREWEELEGQRSEVIVLGMGSTYEYIVWTHILRLCVLNSVPHHDKLTAQVC